MGSALLDLASAAYPAMAEFYASDWAALEARNEGLYVCSGCAISASGTAGKVDLSAGTIFSTTTELNVTAVTAATTTITSLADATNPKWVGLEIDASGVLQFNAGTAAASPVKPALTAARVLVAWLYVPANATAVDALLSTANGKAKIMDARQLMTVHPARQVFTDTAETVAPLTTNGLAVSLLAVGYSIPANSLNVGDTIVVEAAGSLKIAGASNSTVIVNPGPTGALTQITTAAQTFDATNSRRWTLRVLYTVVSIGSGTAAKFDVHEEFDLAAAAASSPALSSIRYVGGHPSGGFDSTAAVPLILTFALGTANASSTATLRQYSITKIPA